MGDDLPGELTCKSHEKPCDLLIYHIAVIQSEYGILHTLINNSNMAALEQPIRLQDCHVWLVDQRLGVFGWLTKAQ